MLTAEVVDSLVQIKLGELGASIIQAAARYLLAAQQPTGKWKDGLSDASVTATVLRALVLSGVNIIDERVVRGLRWVMMRQTEQGAFKTSDNIHRVSQRATGSVLKLLNIFEHSYMREKQKALAWLINKQREDGGFGLEGKQASSLLYTIQILEGLMMYPDFTNSNHAWKVFHFLGGKQTVDGQWKEEIKTKNRDESNCADIALTAGILTILSQTSYERERVRRGYIWLDTALDQTPLTMLKGTELLAVLQAYYQP
jgi:prenyltransferase beta subunit